MNDETWTVGEVAKISGVTVRTLHHYDEVGLLRPNGRTAARYRAYSAADLERLQRMLTYRALGFDLEATAGLLDDPEIDELAHLRRQHALLTERSDRLHEILMTIEKTMEARKMGVNLTPQEMLEVFDGLDPTEHAAEVEERWGGSDAYAESTRRTSSYTKADWQQATAESRDIVDRWATAFRSGVPADSEQAMDLAEEHRRHVSRWFYDCSVEIHTGLGEMYVTDERFAAGYEAKAAGLSAYVRDAIHANAGRF